MVWYVITLIFEYKIKLRFMFEISSFQLKIAYLDLNGNQLFEIIRVAEVSCRFQVLTKQERLKHIANTITKYST